MFIKILINCWNKKYINYTNIYTFLYMVLYVLILLYIDILCKTPKTRNKNIITPLGSILGTCYVLQNQIKDVVDMIEHMYILYTYKKFIR